MPLTERKIKAMRPQEGKERYAVHDGHGLYIVVTASGKKYWHARLYENGKERKVALGRYPEVSLRKAREKRHALTEYPRRQQAALLTFRAVAEEWLTKRYLPSVSNRTASNTTSRLRRFILPKLGPLAIASITPQDVLGAVRPLQEDSLENGQRCKIIVAQVYQYAIAAGLCRWNPAAQLSGALLPSRTAQHYSVVRTPQEAAMVMRAVNGYDANPLVRLGLLLLAYTFVRPNEMRLACWDELELDKAEWRIPPERAKMRREHLVPLSTQAVELFREVRSITRHPRYVFALPLSEKPFNHTMFSRALIRLGYGMGRMTPHGFRGMASTLLNEQGFPPDVIERQLAHIEANSVRAAYNRAEYIDERKKMMQWWGDYLEGLY